MVKKNISFVLAFIFGAFLFEIARHYLTAIFKGLAGPESLILIFLPVVVLWIIVILSLLLSAKPVFLQEQSKEQQFIPVDADEFPQLDINSLQEYTDALEAAGFVQLIDFTIVSESRCFVRLFVHPQHYCWAEVGQIFLKSKKPMPIAASITSAIEPNWSLSTTDREVSRFLFGISYIWRHPRTLWISQPGVTSSKLLQTHLQRLRQIVSTLNLEVTELTDTSLNAYCAFQREERIKRKQALQRKNTIVGLIEALLFTVNPKQEWMGEYGDAVATKIRS
ncbi:hypothetical protein QT970_08430 [Microcoleus sp. herbarium8]|uniref:hypothetical protein n=1 Tax=Microcoleus sp. herbarium8 TaxID=3055436 RepID=UPI002FD00CB5